MLLWWNVYEVLMWQSAGNISRSSAFLRTVFSLSARLGEHAAFSSIKVERFRNMISDLAETWTRVTKLNIGNKHANVHFTCNAIGDSFECLAESDSLRPGPHMASFLLTEKHRETEVKWNSGYQYNTHKLHHAGGIQVNHFHCQFHLRQWKPFGLPSL